MRALEAMSPAQVAGSLQQALALHRAGQLEPAAALYRAVLTHFPDHADALHLSGLIARQQGDLSRAIELMTRAVTADPNHAVAHCNLGVAMHDRGENEAALACYQRALALRPGYAVAWNNSGNALLSLGRVEAALDAYVRATEFDPTSVQAWYHCGIAAQRLQRHDDARHAFEQVLSRDARHAAAWCAMGVGWQRQQQYQLALDCYQRASVLDPNYAEALCNHAALLQRLMRDEEAIVLFDRAIALRACDARAYLGRARSHQQSGYPAAAIADLMQARELGADPEQIAYRLAALGAAAMPQRAPPQHVKELFDQYADHFDRHLQQDLAYDVPALLLAALTPHVSMPIARVLDLGCGTGLCGPLLRPIVTELIGVDLSERMLAHARQRGIYDALVTGEAVEYLRSASNSFGLIVAADVLVYFGDLKPLFEALSATLTEQGRFAFSVEASDGPSVQLGPHHRYAHSLALIEQLAAEHRFAVLHQERAYVRREATAAVAALLIVLRRLPDVASSTESTRTAMQYAQHRALP